MEFFPTAEHHTHPQQFQFLGSVCEARTDTDGSGYEYESQLASNFSGDRVTAITSGVIGIKVFVFVKRQSEGAIRGNSSVLVQTESRGGIIDPNAKRVYR